MYKMQTFPKINPVFFPLAMVLMCHFFTSCESPEDKKILQANAGSSVEQKIQPVDAKGLELTPSEYIDWLRSNNGLTFSMLENDSVMQSIIYQPVELQAALGIENTGMSYEEILKSKKGFHYFFIECIYKKTSAINNTKRSDYLNIVKNNIHVIKNNSDTIRNVMIESFASSILNKPDNVMVLVPDDGSQQDLICSINNCSMGLKEIKINIPKKQFDLFPKLKI